MLVELLILFVIFIAPPAAAGITGRVIATLADGQEAFYFQLYDHCHGSFIILLIHNYRII